MADKKDGHREYAADRKVKLTQLTEALRGSDALLNEFVSKPEQTATRYGLQLTEEEVATLAAIAGSQELSGEALAAVAGGSVETDININCRC
ncbi:MAG TPA: hypothetical protein VFP84_19950 [Kofleriaceae bacterium]|nr:hypothetical protein [Kofleriaceae bacterium]